MGSIKDRNGLDLTEAEDIKKRWQDIDAKRNSWRNWRGTLGEIGEEPLEKLESGTVEDGTVFKA